MTVPSERTRALIKTYELLIRLQHARATPDVPEWLREEARCLLRHYPTSSNVQLAHMALPTWFGPVPNFGKAGGSANVQGDLGPTKGES